MSKKFILIKINKNDTLNFIIIYWNLCMFLLIFFIKVIYIIYLENYFKRSIILNTIYFYMLIINVRQTYFIIIKFSISLSLIFN